MKIRSALNPNLDARDVITCSMVVLAYSLSERTVCAHTLFSWMAPPDYRHLLFSGSSVNESMAATESVGSPGVYSRLAHRISGKRQLRDVVACISHGGRLFGASAILRTSQHFRVLAFVRRTGMRLPAVKVIHFVSVYSCSSSCCHKLCPGKGSVGSFGPAKKR